MAGELIRNLSEKCPLKGLAPVFGVEPSKDVAGLRWSLKKQKTRQAVSLAGFFELSWSSRWCEGGTCLELKKSNISGGIHIHITLQPTQRPTQKII